VKNAQRTLTVIILVLAVLLAGISYLVKVYGIAATDRGQPGYQSLLSMLIAAVFGKSYFYYLTMGSIPSLSRFPKRKRQALNIDYLEATCFESFRGALVCKTRTRWRPVAGIATLSSSKIALAVILRP